MNTLPKGKTIGIVGTRRRDGPKDFVKVRNAFFERYEQGDLIVSGGCPSGGDRFAEKIARSYGIPILIFYPNWNEYGKRAGFVRNTDIAMYSDILIACVARDRKGGTEDTVGKWKHYHRRNENLVLIH